MFLCFRNGRKVPWFSIIRCINLNCKDAAKLILKNMLRKEQDFETEKLWE